LEITGFDPPEKCQLAIIGIMWFTHKRVRYYSQGYRACYPDEIGDLEKALRKFGGMIIGHNLFAFDYRVLRQRISLEGIIEKSIDTLHFLHKKNRKRYRRLKLDELSRENFGKGKPFSGKSIPKMWEQGLYRDVIAYNKNDCILTRFRKGSNGTLDFRGSRGSTTHF